MNATNILFWATGIAMLYGIFALAVALWSLLTHREHSYRERKGRFDRQLDKVSQRLDQSHRKERSSNDP